MIACLFLTVLIDKERQMKYQLKIDDKGFTVDIGEIKAGSAQVVVNGRSYNVLIENSAVPPSVQTVSAEPARVPATTPPLVGPVSGPAVGAVIAPIPGLVLEIKVRQGESVSFGQIVATMEAMKMENNLTAPVSGIVREIRVQKGAEVSTGEIIMQIG
jgi:biotin carboxyl carrier protein